MHISIYYRTVCVLVDVGGIDSEHITTCGNVKNKRGSNRYTLELFWVRQLLGSVHKTQLSERKEVGVWEPIPSDTMSTLTDFCIKMGQH